VPVQVVALSADEAMGKLRRLVEHGKWPANIDAVRLFDNGVEIDSLIPQMDVG
jgi:hypothetical protein